MDLKEEQKKFKNRKNITWNSVCFYLAITGITFLAFFLRMYKLTELPYGIHIDEAGLGVNAYSIANFGVDRYLNSYPVYPKNFDGGQSPFYSYLVAFFIKCLWGGSLDLMVVRLPMVLINMIAFGAGLYLLSKLFDNKWLIFGGFIYAVLPYFIMQCRFGLDCNALVSMLTISFVFLFLALEKDTYLSYTLFGVMWGITYYTYALSYIANTVTLFFISVYILYVRKAKIKKIIATWVAAFLTAIPLVIMVVINTFNLPDIVLGKISIFKLENYRGTELGISLKRIWENFCMVLESILFRDGINYSSFDGFYTMYVCSLPFVLIGFIYLTVKLAQCLKNKEFKFELIFYLVFAAQFIAGMLLSGDSVPQIHRLNGIFFAQFMLVLYGIYVSVQFISKWAKGREKCIEHWLMGVVGATYLVSALLFVEFYFYEYKDAIYPQMLYSDEYSDTLDALNDMGLGEEITLIDASIVYYQFSTQMNPYDLYNTPGANLACYKNYYFMVPAIEKGYVYILRKEDSARISEAESKGLKLIVEDDIWRTYY